MILQAKSGIAIKNPVIPSPNKRKTKICSIFYVKTVDFAKKAEAEKEKLIAQMKAEKEAERRAQEEKELAEWLAEKQKNENQ